MANCGVAFKPRITPNHINDEKRGAGIMKVLHISLYDRYGGACIAAYRQHEALRMHGVDSKMWVKFKVTNDPDVFAYKPPKPISKRLRRILKRQWISNLRKRAKIRGEMFSSQSELGADILAGMPQADVINLQFSWGFADYAGLLEHLDPQVPIVVTIHEMSNFTGGCSYAGECSGFHNRCGNCPQLDNQGSHDWSRIEWSLRNRAFQARDNLHFVADSHWLATEAKKSGLLRDYPLSVIHYGIDTEVFKPLNKAYSKSVFNIAPETKVVAFASASWSNERKGMRHLSEALEGMKEKPFLLTWGQPFEISASNVRRLHLGSLDSEFSMALAYNAADVFVMPSLQEAFGQTALESIACGTPVAAFAAGGIPETVLHGETGLLADVGDSNQLGENIACLLGNVRFREKILSQSIPNLHKLFSYKKNALAYKKLYSEMCGKSL